MEKREEIRNHYAQVAQAAALGTEAPDEGVCCTNGSCSDTTRLYPEHLVEGLPAAALKAARGCGNPLGEVQLREGMTVLDLGCGGGIDCLVSASEVGPTGYVYGLDMTDEMLELAESNKRVAGTRNVEFIKGFIEDIPLPDGIADVVTANCVINLSEDKARALSEARRVLKPGGAFVVADLITPKPEFEGEAGLPLARLFGCRAGVVTQETYERMMDEAGFSGTSLRVYDICSADAARERAAQKGCDQALARFSDDELEGSLAAVFVKATNVTKGS